MTWSAKVQPRKKAVVGETPNLAARLQALAQPGEVVIAQTTRKLIGDAFELSDAGAQALKGIAGKTQAFVVRRERSAESRFEARLSGAVGEMVGRDHELGLIMERWRQAQGGDGQLVLLTGEAGIGKSRVTRALIESVEGQGHARINYQCSPYHTDSALYPAVQQLTHVARITPADSNDDKLDKLEAILRGNEKQLVANALNLATEETLWPARNRPAAAQAANLAGIRRRTSGTVARTSLSLFILEDAHWIDATTLEMVELCLDQLPSIRVLILVTARPTFEHSFSGPPKCLPNSRSTGLSRAQIAANRGQNWPEARPFQAKSSKKSCARPTVSRCLSRN